MKIMIITVLAALAYGGFRMTWTLIKELAEMTAEAWRCGDAE